jgi:UDP-glucose 4-epimerase
LAKPGEAPTVDLHSDADRAPLSVSRMEQEFSWARALWVRGFRR